MRYRIVFLALALGGIFSSCHVDSPMQHNISWEVAIEMQVVSLPEATALPLVPELRDPRQVEGAFKKVQKLIADQQATLIGWPIMITKSGQRAVVEQIDEFRYPTEFEVPGKTTTTQGPAPPANNPGGNQTPPEQPLKITTVVGVTDGGPTAFETRNVGVTLEAEPVIAPDGQTIDLNLVPQHVHFLGWTDTTVETNRPGTKITIQMPRFITNKVTTSLSFRNGERKLLGFFKVPEPAGNVELFIMRVDTLREKFAVESPGNGGSSPLGGAIR